MKKILFLLATLPYLSTTAQRAPAPADSAGQSIALQEVIVTAQQREQQLLDVPAAISTVGRALLENTNTTTMEQLAAFVPGLNINVQTPHRPSFSIRGLTSDEVSPTAQPRVSTYVNNVPVSRASMALAELYDMERVEVLKGPQGTLFGRGAQIGAISLVTKKPVSGFEGYASAGLGNYAAREIEAAVNLPIVSNKLMVRLAGIHSYHDGYVENLSGGKLNGKNTNGGRLSATWLPSGKLSAGITISYQSDDNPGTAFMSKRYPNSKGETDIFNYRASLDNGTTWFNKRNVFGSSLNLKYDFNDEYSLNSITSYYDNNVDHRWDGDGSVAPAIDMAEYVDAAQFTQELRLSFAPSERLNGFAGVSFWRENVKQKYWFGPNEQYMAYLIFQMPQYIINPDGSLGYPMPSIPDDPQLGPLAGLPLPSDHEEESIDGAVNQAADLFFDFTYEILPKLKLTAGARATYESFVTSHEAYMNGSTPSMLGNLLGSAPNFFFAPKPYSEVSKNFLSGTWRANLLYQINPASNLFAGYSLGRRPNVLQFNSAGQSEVMSAEHVRSFDLGYKYSIPNRLWIDASLFYHFYNNFQTSKWDGVNYLVADAGKASAYGVELTAKAAVSRYIELFGNYAWIRARFDDADSNGDRQEYAGNAFRLTPDHSFNLGLHAKASLSRNFRLVFTPSYSWKSHIWFEDANALQPADNSLARLEQNAFGLLNANLSVTYLPHRLGLSIFARNALNRQYLIGAGNTGMMFGVPTYVPGAPRMIGAKLKWSF
jgi:outer membrane receptor protein involved in Fe transport